MTGIKKGDKQTNRNAAKEKSKDSNKNKRKAMKGVSETTQ